MQDKLYRVEEIAAMYKVERSTVYQAIKNGDLVAIRVGRRQLRITAAAVEAWVKAVTPGQQHG